MRSLTRTLQQMPACMINVSHLHRSWGQDIKECSSGAEPSTWKEEGSDMSALGSVLPLY